MNISKVDSSNADGSDADSSIYNAETGEAKTSECIDGSNVDNVEPGKVTTSKTKVNMCDNAKNGEPCLCCDDGPREEDSVISGQILKEGVAIIVVYDQSPHYVYTIGITETYNKPEIIMIGHINIQYLCNIVGACIDSIKENPRALDNEENPRLIGLRIQGRDIQWLCLGCKLLTGANRVKYCEHAALRYGNRGFQAKQIVLPDSYNKLPWHDGYDVDAPNYQPDLFTPLL